MADEQFVLTFENSSTADANRYAEELRRVLLDAAPEIAVEREREVPSSQDFGGALVMVLGAPAVVVAARALHDWLKRRNAVSITLKTRSGTMIAKNLESKDVPAIVRALTANKGHQ